MSAAALWCVSVTTTAEGEEAVSELLSRHLSQPASTYVDLELKRTLCQVFVTARPHPRLVAQLQADLNALASFGLDVGSPKVRINKLRKQDWAESWKRHFPPIEIGRTLLVKPSWSRKAPKPGQALVVLNPGLSFGTGQHPTTRFCLAELTRARSNGAQSLLDVGTGSGILAIAAAKLGYETVRAFDFDPEAVRIARANALENSVRVRFDQKDLCTAGALGKARFSVVCANLIANLLIAEKSKMIGALSPGGLLILAGILETEFEQVLQSYQAAGLVRVKSRREGEWRSVSLASKF